MPERNTKIIDATKIPLGRLSTSIAMLLMGKHKPSYSPSKDEGDYVVVKNLEKIKITGSKMEQKQYHRPTRQPGHLKTESLAHLWNRNPQKVLQNAVMGMLPKNTLRKNMIKRLKIEIKR